MTTMNISLPEELKAFIEAQIKTGGYGNTSEYIRELIREARKRHTQELLEQKLIEGLDSGEPIQIDPKMWEQKRRQIEKRFGKGSSKV